MLAVVDLCHQSLHLDERLKARRWRVDVGSSFYPIAETGKKQISALLPKFLASRRVEKE